MRPKTIWLVALALTAMLLASCGGKEEANVVKTPSPSPAVTPASDAPDSDPVTVEEYTQAFLAIEQTFGQSLDAASGLTTVNPQEANDLAIQAYSDAADALYGLTPPAFGDVPETQDQLADLLLAYAQELDAEGPFTAKEFALRNQETLTQAAPLYSNIATATD